LPVRAFALLQQGGRPILIANVRWRLLDHLQITRHAMRATFTQRRLKRQQLGRTKTLRAIYCDHVANAHRNADRDQCATRSRAMHLAEQPAEATSLQRSGDQLVAGLSSSGASGCREGFVASRVDVTVRRDSFFVERSWQGRVARPVLSADAFGPDAVARVE
jgi:hypothetical protein